MIRRLVAAVTLSVVLVPAVAWPCGNPVALSGDRAVRQIRSAEKLLARGSYAKAIAAVSEFEVAFSDAGLQRQADLIGAVAILRRDPKDRDYAVGQLERLAANAPDAPVVQARLAGALSRGSAVEQQRATTIIEDLVGRDLMPDGMAWVTAAITRAAAGDADGSTAALGRCRKVSKRKAECRLPR